MNFKRFYQKAGYDGTVYALRHNKPFVRDMKKESFNNQMIELLAQFELCRLNSGYSQRLCHAIHHCIGVPFCSKKDEVAITGKIKPQTK